MYICGLPKPKPADFWTNPKNALQVLTVANNANSPWKLKIVYSYAIIVVIILMLHVII